MRLGVMLVKVRLLREEDRGKAGPTAPLPLVSNPLEVETDGASNSARSYVMRSAKRGKKVV
jgi:hypothetical protein